MSWHFSRALVEDCLAQGCLDGDQCAELKSIRIAGKSSFAGKRKATWNPFPSGMMSEPLTAYLGVVGWMSSLPASHASHSALQGNNERTMTLETCGLTPSGSFAKYDQRRRCWKTCQGSHDMNTFTKSLGDLSKAGLIVDGQLFQPQIVERHTLGSDSGFWPTPNTEGYRSDGELRLLSKKCETQEEFEAMSDRSSTSKREKYIPTPNAVHGNGSLQLPAFAARFPTPTSTREGRFATTVKMLPTPTVQDACNNGGPSQANRNTPPLNAVAGGKLNPMWVEWLMGWPIGWTDLEPLETGKFQQWLHSHGKHSQGSVND